MSISREMRIQILLDAMDKASGPIKAIRAESKKAAADLRETTASLGKLEQAQASLKGFRDLKRGLQTTGRELDEARQKAARLARQIAETEKPTKKLTSEFSRAKREAADLGRRFDTQQRELQGVRDRMTAAGLSTRNLVADERRLAREIAATNQKLREQKQRFGELQASAPDRLRSANISASVDRDLMREQGERRERFNAGAARATGIIATAAGAATTATGIDAVKSSASYETQLTTIAQKMELTRVQAEALGIVFDRWGPVIGQRSSEMARGFDVLGSKGLSFNESLVAIRPISKMAVAYRVETQRIADGAHSALTNLQIPAKDLTRVLEVMAAGDARGAFGVEAMADAFPALTGSLQGQRQKGLPALADMVAQLQILRSTAGNDEEAANNLRNLLDKIYAKDTAANFKKLGVDLPAALKKAEREGRPPVEALIALIDQALKGDVSRISHIFGDRQAADAARTLWMKRDQYAAMRRAVASDPGAIDREHKRRSGDTEFKTGQTAAIWEAGQHKRGRQLRPVTNWVLDQVNAEMMRKPVDWKAASLKGAKAELAEAIRVDRAVQASYTKRLAQQRAVNQKMLTEAEQWRAQIRQRYASGSDFRSIGVNMMLGIEQGINSKLPALRAKVVDVVAQIKSWFGAKMEIRSPSRVFARYGAFMMDGLALGIDASARAPLRSLRQVAGRVGAAGVMIAGTGGGGTTSTAAASSGGSAARAPIVQHFHVSIEIRGAPGQDATAIAEQVKALLASEARNAAASSYLDDD